MMPALIVSLVASRYTVRLFVRPCLGEVAVHAADGEVDIVVTDLIHVQGADGLWRDVVIRDPLSSEDCRDMPLRVPGP
jgi:hypothetical protein